MKVSIHRNETSQPIVHLDVNNAYTKGDLYCLVLIRDGITVYLKYPLISIFRIEETDESPNKSPTPVSPLKGDGGAKIIPIDNTPLKKRYAQEAAAKRAQNQKIIDEYKNIIRTIFEIEIDKVLKSKL